MASVRRIAAGGVAAALLSGGLIVLAPGAYATGSDACTTFPSSPSTKHIDTNVNFRSGPKSSSTSKGILTKGTSVRSYCQAPTGGYTGIGVDWTYAKALSGAHKGETGWVYTKHVK